MVAASSPSGTGKYVRCIWPPRISASVRPIWRGAYTSHSLPGTNSGAKNGKPWMWSQWVWVISRCPRIGPGLAVTICWPSSWAPVPQSSTISVPSARTSTQEVLPP